MTTLKDGFSMTKKRFALNSEHGFIGEVKTKAKPKQYIPGRIMLSYLYNRDMIWLNDLFTPQETKEQIQDRLKNNFYERDDN